MDDGSRNYKQKNIKKFCGSRFLQDKAVVS